MDTPGSTPEVEFLSDSDKATKLFEIKHLFNLSIGPAMDSSDIHHTLSVTDFPPTLRSVGLSGRFRRDACHTEQRQQPLLIGVG